MKTILISFLLTLLIVANPPKESSTKNTDIDVDAIIAKSQMNFFKADTVTKVADKQQNAKMTELNETVTKLV